MNKVESIIENAIRVEARRNLPLTFGVVEILVDDMYSALEAARAEIAKLNTRIDELTAELQGRSKAIKSTMIRVRDKQETTKLLDSRDKRKVDFFCAYLEEVGEEKISSVAAFKKIKGLRSALYDRTPNRLWLGWSEFHEDFTNWLHNKGSYTINKEEKHE